MGFRFYAVLFALFAVAGVFAGTRARVWAQAEPVKPKLVELQKLRENPQAYKKQAVVFTCRFIKTGELFRHDSAQFTAAEHVNFMVWPVEAALWDKNVRQQVLSSLFVSKKNREALTTLNNLSRYDTLKIIGTVEETYANLPWINVEKVILIPGELLNDTILQHVARGNEYLQKGDKSAALAAFAAATTNGAPTFVRQYIQAATATENAPTAQIATPKKVENYMPLVEAAREAARNNDLSSAERLYLQAREKCDNNAWLYREIGLFYEYEYSLTPQADKLDAALQAYRKAEILGGRNADVQFLQARVAYTRGKNNGEFALAESLVKKCLTTNAEHALARQLSAEITAAKLAAAPKMPPLPLTPTLNLAAAPAKTLMPEQHLELANTLLENNNREGALKHLQIAADSNAVCARAARAKLTALLDAELETVKKNVTATFAEIERSNAPTMASAASPVLNVPEAIMPMQPTTLTPADSLPLPNDNVNLDDLPDWAQ